MDRLDLMYMYRINCVILNSGKHAMNYLQYEKFKRTNK